MTYAILHHEMIGKIPILPKEINIFFGYVLEHSLLRCRWTHPQDRQLLNGALTFAKFLDNA